jgi:aryl-alcohol dehydrogenase-like predicted oxidoreductase
MSFIAAPVAPLAVRDRRPYVSMAMPHRPSVPAADTPLSANTLRGTELGTARYAQRFAADFAADFFRPAARGLTVSSLGAGTYLGDPTDADDQAYTRALCAALVRGVNLIDTAINYRCQRSERAVGTALEIAIGGDNGVEREGVVICTKGGYIPLAGDVPATRQAYQDYVQREFIANNVMLAEEIVGGGHCLAPRFLRYCIAQSRQNLGVRMIDVYYLHNPEQQLATVPADELRSRLRAAFTALEESVGRGDIGVYGCATWNGLRVAPGSRGHLSLEDLVAVAREVAGDAHHFAAVQLPVNLAMPEAIRTPTQPLGDSTVTVLEAAEALGVTVIASASLMQAQLAQGLPEAVRDSIPGLSTDAQRAVTFVRKAPSVATALVGMRSQEHLEENLAAAR